MAGKSLFLDTTGITRILNPSVLCDWKLLTEITHRSGVFCPLLASHLSREDGTWLPNSRKVACESQLREPDFGNLFAPQAGPQGCTCSWALLWTVCQRRLQSTCQVGSDLLAPVRRCWFLLSFWVTLLSYGKMTFAINVIQSILVNYHIFSWYIASVFRTFRKNVTSLKKCLGNETQGSHM